MIKTSQRMAKRRAAGIHPERSRGFFPVYRAPHNQAKDMAAMKDDDFTLGNDEAHPLSRKASVIERGAAFAMSFIWRAVERNNRLINKEA